MDLNVVLVRKQYGKQFVLVSVPKVVLCFISQPGFLKMRLRDASGCSLLLGWQSENLRATGVTSMLVNTYTVSKYVSYSILNDLKMYEDNVL